MERSSRRVDNLKSLEECVKILYSPKRDLESSVEHVESLVEHEVSSVSSVGSLNYLIKSVEEVECPNRSGEQVITLKSLTGSLGSSVDSRASSDSLAWIMDSSNIEQEEQVHVEKDMRVVLEVQDEKW